MNEVDQILNKMENVEKDISSIKDDTTEIKIAITRNTKDLEHHIKRTDELQDMVTPLYKDFIAKQAVTKYKKEARADLLFKLKLPGYIVAALVAVGTLLAFLMSK